MTQRLSMKREAIGLSTIGDRSRSREETNIRVLAVVLLVL